MATITTRAGKGSPLTNDEVDANFTNLNTDKAETNGATLTNVDINSGTIDGVTIGGASAGAGTFTTLTGSGDMNIDSGTLFVDVSENKVGIGTTTLSSGAYHNLVLANNLPNYAQFTRNDGAVGGGWIGSNGTGLLAGTHTGAVGSETYLTQFKIDLNGDISFYEDTGTTPKLFWDSSAEALGIGTTSLSGLLHLSASTDDTTFPSIVLQDSGTTATRLGVLTNNSGDINLSATASLTEIRAQVSVRDDRNILFGTGGSERMRINNDGNVGIGTTSIRLGERLHVLGQGIVTSSAENTNMGLFGTFGGNEQLIGSFNNIPVVFRTNNTEKMRIDSSGNLGIGGTPKPYLNPNYNALDMHAGRTVLMSSSGTPQTNLQTNAYYDSTDSRFEYSQTGYAASNYVQQGGEHKFFNAPSGTAGNAITFTQAMTLDASGRLGIGTTTPEDKLDVDITAAAPSTSNFLGITVGPTSGSTAVGEGVGIGFRLRNTAGGGLGGNSFGGAIYGIQTNTAANTGGLAFYTRPDAGTFPERMRIDSSGNVGIGTSSPDQKLHINGTNSIAKFSGASTTLSAYQTFFNNSAAKAYFGIESSTGTGIIGTGAAYGMVLTTASTNPLCFGTNGAEKARIDSSGNLLVGTTSARGVVTLQDTGTSNIGALSIRATGSSAFVWGAEAFAPNLTANQRIIHMIGVAGSIRNCGYIGFRYSGTSSSTSNVLTFGLYNHDDRMTLDSAGNLSILGALSKGSGSFKIDHPIKPETHHLVHSFVEAPQADNIYRGKVDLVDGTATVNIDTIAGMTEGTFNALNREVQCFTSNESGWTAVRGSVSGNILTIEAQDSTCTDTISWMVVGERKDQHMYDTDWTDENGKVIVEPLKETET